jgi:MATE family multidrug resistance protein
MDPLTLSTASSEAPGTLGTPANLRTLLALAWPIVLARATQSVIGFTDALMVAPLGKEALAATTTGGFNTFMFIILPMGTVFIVQSFTAQLRGRGDLVGARRYAHYGLVIALVAGLLSALAIPWVAPLLHLFGYEPLVEELMAKNVSVRLLSVGGAVGTEAIGNYYGGLGRTRPAMVAGLIAMISNVFLNWLLIEPRFGLPGYGVVGAGVASVIATWLGLGAIALLFVKDGAPSAGRLRLDEFRRVLRFGLPNGVNWFLEFSAFTLFINVVVGHLGTTELAAFNLVFQINGISFMPAFGLASAGAILVGEAIGRKALDQVGRIVRMTGMIAACWMVPVGASYFIAPELLVGLFRPRGAPAGELIAIGTTMLKISALWQLFDAACITLSESLRAAGDTTWCMGARIVLAWLVFMPSGWVVVNVFDGGPVSVMACVAGYVAALSLTFGVRFLSGRWRNIDLVGERLPL